MKGFGLTGRIKKSEWSTIQGPKFYSKVYDLLIQNGATGVKTDQAVITYENMNYYVFYADSNFNSSAFSPSPLKLAEFKRDSISFKLVLAQKAKESKFQYKMIDGGSIDFSCNDGTAPNYTDLVEKLKNDRENTRKKIQLRITEDDNEMYFDLSTQVITLTTSKIMEKHSTDADSEEKCLEGIVRLILNPNKITTSSAQNTA